jgi:ferredoxin
VEIGKNAFLLMDGRKVGGETEPRITSVYIPDSVTKIGEGAFDECTALKQVRLSEKLTAIPEDCFYECSSLSEITIPASVKSIGDASFSASDSDNRPAPSLTTVTIPEGVESIGFRAFGSSPKLTEVSLPESLQTIGQRAFSNCPELTTVNLPKHPLKYLNENGKVVTKENDFVSSAFKDCPKLSLKVRSAIKASGYLDDF